MMSDDELFQLFATTIKGFTPPDEAEGIIFRICGDEARARAVRERYAEHARRLQTMKIPGAIVKNGLESWYAGPGPNDPYWPPLRAFLAAEGWNAEDIDNLDRSSTKIVAHLPHPATHAFNARGLVLGYVQSGKTTSFTAVIAKAADVHYRLFIVLSGIHEGLRFQTQRRLDRQLVDVNPAYWQQLTYPDKDFEGLGSAANFLSDHANNRALVVVKKNAPRLRRLKRWLQNADSLLLASCPVLVIDDEADQATVNTALPGNNASAINRLVREILQLCPRAAYIGYTATPFANLFIDPSPEVKDLYPRDFIIDLPRPPEYFGSEELFGREPVDVDDDGADGLDMIRRIDDAEAAAMRPSSPAGRYSFAPEVLPALQDAITWFWLATAARRARAVGVRHSSMLIHTSVHPIVHDAFRSPIASFRDRLAALVESGDQRTMAALRLAYEDEVDRVPAALAHAEPVPFRRVAEELPDVLAATRVIADNSSSTDRLDYTSGTQTVIAVGGNTLSRGLTLEGLVSSYFVRSASAYDTLLQMGRWFGYRRGYADMPRVWLTDELRSWFRDLARVEFEMRQDVARYEAEHLTPHEFAVRIRTHPQLAITAASKMRQAVDASMSFEGRRLQTIRFRVDDRAWLTRNLDAARRLVRNVRADGHEADRLPTGQFLIREVDVGEVLTFLRDYRFDEKARDFRPDLIEDYVRAENARCGDLERWNIAIMSTASSLLGVLDLGLVEPVPLIGRSRLRDAGSPVADIKSLMTKVDRVIDLPVPWTRHEIAAKSEKELADVRRRLGGGPAPGLLLLYPISKDSVPRQGQSHVRAPLAAVEHVVGVALVFPSNDGPGAVRYKSANLSHVVTDSLDPDEEVAENDGDEGAS